MPSESKETEVVSTSYCGTSGQYDTILSLPLSWKEIGESTEVAPSLNRYVVESRTRLVDSSKEVMRNEQYTIDASRRLKFVISITSRYAVDRFVNYSATTTLNNKNFGWRVK